MNKENYRSEIIRIISETDSFLFIASVYSFIRGMLSVGNGSAKQR